MNSYLPLFQNPKTSSVFNICYDQQNNIAWGLNDDKKTFNTLYCFNNSTIPEVHSYPEDSEFYTPFENQKLIEVAEEEIELGESSDSSNLAKERLEKKKEDIQLLYSLGFHVKSKGGEKIDIKAEKSENLALRSKATQLFILSNISRLATSYASIEYMNIEDPASNIRRPYCVHLMDKTFEYLEQFLDNYNKTFFNAEIKEQLPDDEFIDQCSFLATLRILKYNLAALENFSASLNDLGVEIVNEGFSGKLEKLIWSILEMKPRENKELEDLRQAVYQEALSILKYTLSIMYPNFSEILTVLRKSLKNLDKKLYRDTSIAILFWLKSRDHISRLVNDIVNSADNQKLIDEIKQLINDVIGWDVQNFTNDIKAFSDYQKPGKYHRDELLTTGMSFLIELQKEVLYQLGQKAQEKGLEVTPIHTINTYLTEAISRYGVFVNVELQAALERLSPQVTKSVEAAFETGEEAASPEPKGDKGKKDSKKKKSKTELLKEGYSDLWEAISNRFTEGTYFFQVLALQINTLALLSSNFLIATKTLKQVTSLLTSFNSLYTAKKELDKSSTEKISKIETEKSESVESEHPPPVRAAKKDKIHIPGAKQLRIVFDPKCDLKQNCDYLEFFTDEKMKEKVGERLTSASTFPKGDLIVKGDTVWYNFHKDGCRNSQWGYKFTVYAKLEDRQETDWISSLHRTTTWLAGKCAAQLINGSALQQAMLADEEQRYNALLNSKLFSGGIEKCYFTGGKEGIWTQVGEIMNEYQAGHLVEYLSGEMTEEEKAEEEFLNSIIFIGKDPDMEKILDFIQKAFVKEALWGNLGGENGSRIVRATFAVIVKHGGLINDLKEAMIDIEVDEDVKKGKLTPNLKNLLKRWHAASRMRPWLVEKRKDIDDLEDKRKNQQAAKSPAKPTTTKAGSKKKTGASKKKEEEEVKKDGPEEIMTEEKDSADPIVSGQMQVRDTEEIIQKMIDQIVKKAQFLCQLIPAKHWTQDRTEKKEKQLLFRSASRTDSEVNKEEEWKRRLQQWKSVRQAKTVHKSLEDESQEISSSLSSSVLLCLQSAVSIRRLRKQVESAYLRAICRTIGLNALTSILHGCQSSLFRQDVVGWLCSSLRGADSKLYHFTDNLQGCGHYLESAVNTAFKNLIIAIVRSMARSTQSEELKCMLEALKWKYHGDDHVFLAEVDLFGILRGNEQQPLLRGAWGKSLHPVSGSKSDHALVKKLVTLFETVVVLCVGKLNMNTTTEAAAQPAAAKKDKIPLLERHVSVLDEYSVDILIRQAFHVLFSELDDADKNYKEYKGIDWVAYQRYLRRKEIEAEKDKKNAKKDKKPTESRRARGLFDDDAEEALDDEVGSPMVNADDKNKDKKEEESDIDEEIELEFIEELKEEEKVAEEKQEETKEASKKETDPKKSKTKRLKEIIEKEEKSLFDMQNKLYDPDFLYRLLCLIFKCVTMGSDIVSAVVGNPKYISILLSLMKCCPPQHQIIILKTLDALFEILPVELFHDSVANLGDRIKSTETDHFKVTEKDSQSIQIIKYLLNYMTGIRSRGFEVTLKHPDIYAVSSELVGVLRNLLENANWNKDMTEFVIDGLSGDDVITKQVILSIIGGEINGLRYGGKIHISSTDRDEIFEDNVLLKSKLPESTENATILGFTQEYKEKLSEEEKKKREEKKDMSNRSQIYMSIGSAASGCNPLVLIHSTINKELTTFASIELTTVPRFNSVAVDTVPFNVESFDLSKNLERLMPIFKWAIGSDAIKDSNNLYLRALSMKALSTYANNDANAYMLYSKHSDIVNQLLTLATKTIVSTDSSSLEITEEKLYRLLQHSCENEASLGELPTMAATIKGKELEILLGKDLSSMKYTITSGFNIEKITTHHEVLIVDDPATLAKKKDLKEYLSTRAVLIPSSAITSEKYPEIILNAQIVITHGYDMQKFQDYWEANFAKSAKGKKPEKEVKAEGAEEEEKKPVEETIIMPESTETKKQEIKLPNCLINISEKSYNNILKEYKNQLTKEYKDVFEVKKIVDELVEFGFPRDVCEKYLQEHSKESFDVMINDIVKIIEQNEQDKLKAPTTSDVSDTKGSVSPGKAQAQSKQGGAQPQAGAQGGEMKMSKGGNKGAEEAKGEEEKKEEEGKGEETEAEKELKLKMLKAEKMAKGGQLIDDDALAKKKKQPEEEGVIGKNKGQAKEGEEPVIGGGKKEPVIGEIPAEKEKPADDDEEEEEEEVDKKKVAKRTFDVEKEDANPCFRCKGEKELQAATEEKNKNYDELLDFEGMNRIGKLVLFKQLCYNLSIFYARRTLLNLLERWSDDVPIQMINEPALQTPFLTFIKLVSNEGIFSSSSFCNNDLIRKIRKILENIFGKESQNKVLSGFIDKLISEGVRQPIDQLAKKFADHAAQTKKGGKGKGADDSKDTTYYSGKNTNESEIAEPNLDYSLWLAQTVLNSSSESVKKRIYNLDVLYQLFGFIPSIRFNRSLLWGVLIFCLDVLDKFITNIDMLELQSKNILNHPNVVVLHDFFDALKGREKIESLSRRTQITCEILINLNRLQKVIENKYKVENIHQETIIDLTKYKNIENLADVVEVMENYQENKSLIASSWLEVSPDLIKSEQKVIDGDHFYFKNPHTFKVNLAHASECTIKFSEDCQTDPGDSLLFSSDPKGELSVQKSTGHLSKKTLNYPSGTFYVHFPTHGADVVAFGNNEQYQFFNETANTGPVVLEEFSSWNTVRIDGGDSHTVILNNLGELWSMGTGNQTGQSGTSKVPTKIAAKDKVRLFSCGSNFTIFVTEANELYAVGNNGDGRAGLNWNSGTASPQIVELSGSKIVKQLSCGFNHSLLITTEHVLFATGSNEHGQLGINDESGNKVTGIQTFRQVTDLSKKKNVKAIAGQYFSMVLVREKGKHIVMTAGEKAGGKLGLGDDIATSVTAFTPITALEEENVIDIHAKRKHAVAVTSSGKLYTWGINEHGQLGHDNKENLYTPKAVAFFDGMKVVSASTGASHTVVIAKTKGEEKNKLYVMGDNTNSRLGIKGKDKLFLPTQIDFFDEKSPMKVYTGTNHSFVITEPIKLPKVRDVHKFKCHLTGESEINGHMYVDILNGNKTYSATAAEDPKNVSTLPPVLVLVKEAITSVKEIQWPVLEASQLDDLFEPATANPDFGVKCSVTGQPITGVCFVNMHQHEYEPQEYLCADAVKEIPEGQVSQTLYYRITRKLKPGKSLPVAPRTNFSAQSDTYGYNITVTPKFNEKGHDYMTEKYKESFEAFYGDMKQIKPEVDEQFVDLINNFTQKLEKNVFDLSDNITFPKEEIAIRQAIEKSSQEFLKKRFLILKNLNTKFKSLLPYIDFSAKKETTRLRNIYANASVYIFWDVKSSLFDELLANDAKGATNPKVKVNRLKASKFIAKGKPDHTGEYTVFGQIFQHFKSEGYNCFKVAKDVNPFTVQFVGEASVDVGGPYREAISQLCTELQSGALPLFTQSPNQKNDSGQFREKWVFNPSATSLVHMQMFEFLGVLMGCSIRTRNFLNLDLPSIIWKQLVDVPVTRKDLEYIDRYLIQCLDDIIHINKKGVDENTFSDIIQEKFVTTQSDGSEVELIPGGKSKIVT